MIKNLIAMMGMIALVNMAFSVAVEAKDKPSITLGVSYWGILDSEKVSSFVAGYEFQALEPLYGIKPNFTFMLGEHNIQYFALGGTKYFPLSDTLALGIGFSAGYLNKSADLGSDLEFYSRGILRYSISQQQKLRLEFGHISNAGISHTNPGSENLVLAYEYQF